MMIALASDHVGYPLKLAVAAHLETLGVPFKDYGTHDTERVDYPLFAREAARAVVGGECERALLFCGTGVGISIAANKVKGVRCVVCSDVYSAVLSRQHNDTNMLALGSRVVGEGLAVAIVDGWLAAVFEGGRHMKRIEQIARIEEE